MSECPDTEVRYSFLTTNYNKADVLERSVRSMLRALPANGELIVVDGGSTDDSLPLLRDLAATDDRLRVIVEPSNLGEGRQIALERARGDVLVQHVDTDRTYDSAMADLLDVFEVLENRYDDLVLCTLDSLYVSRPEPIHRVGGWPPLGRVEERLLVERLCRNPDVTFRVLPVAVSRELPSADTATLRRRARKWRRTARDLRRVGFTLSTLVRYNHRRFPLPKALLADLLCALGAYDARNANPIAVEPNVPRGPAVVESWQNVLRSSPDFFPDGEDTILSPADLSTTLPDELWVDLETEDKAGTPPSIGSE